MHAFTDAPACVHAGEEGGGWRGLHTEATVWHTLFGLLMWPVLFAPVPEVFRHPFQTAPLDLALHSDAFLPARAGAVRARLQLIEGEGASAHLTASRMHAASRRLGPCILEDGDGTGTGAGSQCRMDGSR